MNTNHTPGPWTLNPAQSTRVDLIDNHKGEAIGEIVWVDVRNPADARLIAAAPELLEALKYCRQKIAYMQANGEWYSPGKAIEKADAAIAKATA
jgi:hypothetical protein